MRDKHRLYAKVEACSAVSKIVKFGKLPVKFSLAAQHMSIRPDDFGQMWNIQFSITPVLPKLVKGVLFDF